MQANSPTNPRARKLALASLRADSVYCALAAVCVCLFASALAPSLAVPQPTLYVAGGVVSAWALLLWVWSTHARLRPILWFVMTANRFAAISIGGLATMTSRPIALTILLAAVAVEVAAFGATQAASLRRLTLNKAP